MAKFRGVCIILAAGLMTAAPCVALAQGQAYPPDTHAAPPPARVHTTPGGVTIAHYRQGHTDVRIADHYARLDDARAEAAWKRGDRKAACRWARTAETDAGLRALDYAYMVDEYCG